MTMLFMHETHGALPHATNINIHNISSYINLTPHAPSPPIITMIPLTELCHSCPHRNTAHCNSCATDRMPPPHQVTCFLTRSQQRITIVGAHLAPEEPEEDPLVLGVFKPKDGVREKLRETLHNVLAVEMAERAKEVQFEETEGVTSVPNAVTISKNTRYAAQEVVLLDINTHAQNLRN